MREGEVSDRRECRGESDGDEGQAAVEGAVSERRKCRGKIDGGERLAFPEGLLSNRREGRGEGDRGQGRAFPESPISDRREGLGKSDGGESGAAVEGILVDGSNSGQNKNVRDEFPPLVFWLQDLPVELELCAVIRRGRRSFLLARRYVVPFSAAVIAEDRHEERMGATVRRAYPCGSAAHGFLFFDELSFIELWMCRRRSRNPLSDPLLRCAVVVSLRSSRPTIVDGLPNGTQRNPTERAVGGQRRRSKTAAAAGGRR